MIVDDQCMIVGGQTEARAKLSSTIIDYHEPFHQGLRTFARNFSNIDFFLKLLPLKDDELAMSEM